MAELNDSYPTLLDVTTGLDPNGNLVDLVEMLMAANECFEDMSYMEGNQSFGHRASIRTGLPEVFFRKFYGGIQPTKSTRANITDACAMLEAHAIVDVRAADLNGNRASFRLSEDKAFIQSMAQKLATALFYGDETLNPEQFTGFAPRFNDLSAENADNIIDAGGTGSDNASIWLVGWSTETVTGIYPKASSAGLKIEDMGIQLVDAPDGGGKMRALVTAYTQDAGLHVKDWRYVVRICNIDRSLLTNDLSTGADLNDLMSMAVNRIEGLSGVKPAFYMDRTIREMLGRQAKNAVSNSTLTMEQNEAGRPITTFDGIVVRRVDELSVDEARVV